MIPVTTGGGEVGDSPSHVTICLGTYHLPAYCMKEGDWFALPMGSFIAVAGLVFTISAHNS